METCARLGSSRSWLRFRSHFLFHRITCRPSDGAAGALRFPGFQRRKPAYPVSLFRFGNIFLSLSTELDPDTALLRDSHGRCRVAADISHIHPVALVGR